MGFLTDWLTDWLKELLIEGIMGNLTGLFDSVNSRVGEIAVQVDVYKRQACDDADAGYNDTSVFSLNGRLGAILGGVRVP